MNEPRKRGRPVKVAEEVVEELQAEPQAIVNAADPKAQAYAERIYAGQSPDLNKKERLARVTRGVEAQGMSMEGVIL